MTEDIEREFKHLWEQRNEGWALLKSPDLRGGYCVVNKRGSILLIEVDEVNEAVCKRMKDAGCEVLDTLVIGEAKVELDE
jgi:hypothetical protein